MLFRLHSLVLSAKYPHQSKWMKLTLQLPFICSQRYRMLLYQENFLRVGLSLLVNVSFLVTM